jgi:serine/threonine-protein kinase
VLPTDIGADTAHAYLADGLSGELTTKLSKIPGLSVRAYSSSKAMRGKGAREAGKALGVGAIVTASVVRSGSELRVTASLVNSADDNVIWSETFPARDGDQFALQDSLVAAISGALRLSLTPATRAAVTARGTRSNEAHDLVQRSLFLVDQFTRESINQGIAAAEAAIRLDSTYAAAWAAAANAWGQLADDFESPAKLGPRLVPLAERAYALDSTSAPAVFQYATLVYWYQHDVPRAVTLFEKALRLDSTSVDAVWYTFPLRLNLGLPDSAARVRDRALRHNPYSRLAWAQAVIGDFTKFSRDSASSICEHAARVDKNAGDYCRAKVLAGAGDRIGAAAVLRRASEGTNVANAPFARQLALFGDTAGARNELARALQASKLRYVREDAVARAFAATGDRESAIRWWQKAAVSNSAGLTTLGFEREDSTLLSDPRIIAIRSRFRQR